MNDTARFRPSEADVPTKLMPDEPAAPQPSSVLDAFGNPLTRPQQPVDSTVPLKEVMALRSGLTDDMRAYRAQPGKQQAGRVAGMYKDALDSTLEQSLPAEYRQQWETARAARRDVADRFERPTDALAQILRQNEGGQYQVNDAAVPGRFAQPDNGRLSDLKSLLREAGGDTRVRDALSNEVMADVQARGLLNKPEALQKYLGERRVLLSEFPELDQKLAAAGAKRTDLTAAERAAADTQKRLTTPGRSPQASYLKYADEASADAMRTVVSSPKPREAVQELLKTATTPTARQDLRAALWQEVTRSGKMSAPGVTGETRWNGKKLRSLLDDPKFSAVADELWADDPEDLANIRKVFDALATAEGSVRAKAPNTSGTAQSLAGKLDPSLTTTSIASRVRSVNRNQMSPGIAIIDVASTWLRNRSAKVQARAIDAMASAVVNNPGLAADLLEKFNPTTVWAQKALITQKYGVRATQLLNILDEAQNEDPVMDAIGGNR